MQVRKLAAALGASGVLMASAVATAGAANAATTAPVSSHVAPAANWYISNYYPTSADCIAWGESLMYFGIAQSYDCEPSGNTWALWVLPF
jgi:hypothetical protein